MRDAYREQLDAVTGRLIGMARKANEQMRWATSALLTADLALAEKVVEADPSINRDQLEIDEMTIEVMATQSPVAGDLRFTTSSLRTTADIERMGDLTVHIAKITRMRYPDHAVPEDLRSTFAAMGRTAENMVDKAVGVLRSHDLAAAAELARDDNEMDRLHRSLFLVLFDENWDRGVEAAVDIALLGRYYERFADHAVEIAANVRYLVTGEVR
ncbi:phosphate signaling complex protein PhoU [Phytoactinopolyspora mesophila]|uniref:Phosphate-specific transport system accessory protein PhoU n=1 Tax=Phytoactinopolyspora mesophila TaxID=2650750 RepID=A0A7K3M490_9ACTN|nr:phosphate signaling complex protein PhoU [Phytoactinopolyspora mesophila]NDL58134.1 phosphate signaling complex protein PhoU [Phytoactinopolyspora mesophila]